MDSISLSGNSPINSFGLRNAAWDRNGSSAAEGKTLPEEPARESDMVSLSPEGRQISASETSEKSKTEEISAAQEVAITLSEVELKELRQLKSRDTEVRTHEQAHLSTAGQYAAGGASFTYQQGPDGNRYAVGGEVPIDIAKEKTPEETIQKMQVIKRAALAPASPSAADRQIAAQAAMTEAQARQEVLRNNQQELNKNVANHAKSETPLANREEKPDNVSSSASAAKNIAGSRQMMIAAYSAVSAW